MVTGIKVALKNAFVQEENVDIRRAWEKFLLIGKPVRSTMECLFKAFQFGLLVGQRQSIEGVPGGPPCIEVVSAFTSLPRNNLNYTHEEYSNLFILYEEYDKVSSRTCDVFANRYPEKQKLSPNSVKRIIENLQIMALGK